MSDNENPDMTRSQQQFAVGKDRVPLTVTCSYSEEGVTLVFALKESEPCLLHWGLVAETGGEWIAPPRHLRPEGSIEI